MIFLIFILNLFAETSIIDNCPSEICNAVIKVGGVEKFGQRQMDKTAVLAWLNSKKDKKTSWGRPEEIKDICPTGYIPTDIDGNPVAIDTRTETSKVVVNLEYNIYGIDGNVTGTANHDCDRYTFPPDFTIELTDAQNEKAVIDYERVGAATNGFCNKIYNMVLGYNISKQFSTSIQNQMKNDFSAIHDSIRKDCQPVQAKAAIEGITADPAKFTQEFKDMVLNEFTKVGL